MSKVYHVANPDVPGEVQPGHLPTPSDFSDIYVPVRFDEPVGFSGNQRRGKQTFWFCNENLLFTSPQEARDNHNPNHDPYVTIRTLNDVTF